MSVVGVQGWNENPLHAQLSHETLISSIHEEVIKPTIKTNLRDFKIDIFTDRAFFVAGSFVHDLKCTSNTCKVNSIELELIGMEEVRDEFMELKLGKHSLIKKSIQLQAPHLPPCEAVIASSGMDENDYWIAKRGDTRYMLESSIGDCVSSYKSKTANVNYFIIVSVGLLSKTSRPIILRALKQIYIYQFWNPIPLDQPVSQTASEIWGMLGARGDVKLNCELDQPFYCAGNMAYLHLTLDNKSKKKINRVKISIIQRVKTFRKIEGVKLLPLSFSRKEIFKMYCYSKDWDFKTIVEPRSVIIDVPIPQNVVTIKNAKLLEITFVLQASISVAFNKMVSVELPLDITHPSSFTLPKKQFEREITYIQTMNNEEMITTEEQKRKTYHQDSAFQSEVELFPNEPRLDVLTIPDLPKTPIRSSTQEDWKTDEHHELEIDSSPIKHEDSDKLEPEKWEAKEKDESLSAKQDLKNNASSFVIADDVSEIPSNIDKMFEKLAEFDE